MKIRRTVPPAAAPIKPIDLLHGFTGLLSGGNKYRHQLEQGIKEYFDVRHVWCVSSGKAGLTLILLGLRDLSNRKRVVIPAYTCFSVPSAIVKAGLEVALCDIDPETLDFDQKSLEMSVDKSTLCVIPNHLFGIPSNMDVIARLCREHGAYLVEDAAQAMGGRYKDKKLGAIGDVGFFSFGRGKNITCGSGGIIISNSDRIARSISAHYIGLEEPRFAEEGKEFIQVLLMSVLVHPLLYWLPAGMPSLRLGQTFFHKEFPVKKMGGMKAGMLYNWRNRLAQSNHTRAETAAYFNQRLRATSERDPSIPYLRLPILVDSPQVRARIDVLSQEMGLGVTSMYPTPIDEIEEIRTSFKGKAFPSARRVAERLLTIPTHALLSAEDKKHICRLFSAVPFFDQHQRGEIAEERAVFNSVELL
jgi:perosamine synthetase